MKTIVISESLHKQLKVRAAKEGEQLQVLISKYLWDKLGGVRNGS